MRIRIAALVMMLSGAIAVSAQQVDRAQLASRVRAELLSSWRAYEQYAWGHDELQPVSRTPRDWYGQSLLMTPVDSLDTLLIVGLHDEAEKAKSLIVEKLSFDKDISVQNFEVTIRLLGGLLSAYQMTGDERLLHLADDLGTRLLPVFDSPTGMPYRFVNLRTGKTRDPKSNPAEIGTLLLEFGTLSKLTHKPVYFDKAKNAVVQLYKRRSKIGLVGDEIDVETGQWTSTTSHVGGGIDSYYEYLLKCARLFDDKDCLVMWQSSIRAVNKYLADDTKHGFWYGEADMTTGKRTATQFGALHAFLPAVLALGGDVRRAEKLEASCFRMWQLHGIEPEVIDYDSMKVLYPGYPLRPEIIESAFYLRRYTKNDRYLAMGRTFFEAIVANCRTDAGYTTIKNVVTREKGDLMPSYFLAETLKYFYLLFADDVAFDPGNVVFNTEAHPLRRTW
ncbi:MAG TPA: glycoside hydrolase family 47 protein [Thermoanaerobaculia bacterium]